MNEPQQDPQAAEIPDSLTVPLPLVEHVLLAPIRALADAEEFVPPVIQHRARLAVERWERVLGQRDPAKPATEVPGPVAEGLAPLFAAIGTSSHAEYRLPDGILALYPLPSPGLLESHDPDHEARFDLSVELVLATKRLSDAVDAQAPPEQAAESEVT